MEWQMDQYADHDEQDPPLSLVAEWSWRRFVVIFKDARMFI